MSYTTTLIKIKGQYALIIPDEVMTKLHWKLDDTIDVTLTPEKNIVLTRVVNESSPHI